MTRPPRVPPPDPDLLLQAAALGPDGSLRRDLACGQLAALPPRPVDQAILAGLRRHVSQAWRRGWLPADLLRLVRRDFGDLRHGMTMDAVVAELDQHGPAGVASSWRAQLGEATRWWADDATWASEWATGRRVDRMAMVAVAADVLALLSDLPRLPLLGPPPGQPGHVTTAGEDGLDERTLGRVRALLAKAESTTFAEEAEAYTRKAQELIARHRVDRALVAAASPLRAAPTATRVGVDAPYEAENSLLLAGVATANRCRSVWSTNLGFATVFGFADDVRLVELLYTSLLVQAGVAMAAVGAGRDRAGRSMRRSFRQSFLAAYAVRIGQRLDDASRLENERAAAGQPALLPVLAARDEAVTTRAERMFPKLSATRLRIKDGAGATAGRDAADQALLRQAAMPALGSAMSG
ncbi:DUF2786 domain-containing protein [Pilimelia columellifera]|uniref:DUF2786 domain-containing protein n=1 Tax=Pilimelia columellifera subsp. columellifera TaxID=706583 RepID=A0ABP6AYR9_9ACTN